MDTQKGFITRFGEWWDEQQARRHQTAPRERPSARHAGWLPSRGNVIFTLAMIALLIAAQSVGALPLGERGDHGGFAPTATSTGAIAYQGRLADAAGQPLTGTYNMIFRLYTGATGGAPLWTEQWTGSNGVRVSDGLFNVMLGSLTQLPISQFTNSQSLFLGITVGTDDEMQPRVQLGSVPFAVQALTVPDGSVTTAKIADGAVTASKLAPDMLAGVPRGTIVMWAGPVSSIPAGWALCDGANGTPDLRDRFILSIGAGENPGATGGSHTKTLDVSQLPPHTHSFTTSNDGSHSHYTHFENEDGFGTGSKSGADDTSGNGKSTTSNGSHSHSGTTNSTGGGAPFDVRPAYFKLAFIMKL